MECFELGELNISCVSYKYQQLHLKYVDLALSKRQFARWLERGGYVEPNGSLIASFFVGGGGLLARDGRAEVARWEDDGWQSGRLGLP